MSGYDGKGNEVHQEGASHHPEGDSRELKATAVYFEVIDDEVVVRAVRDAAGSLSEYAGNAKPDVSMKRMEDRAWEEAVHEKAGKKSA